jgi:hypothetical protein
MPSRCEEAIHNMLLNESVTLNEVVKKLSVNFKTAKDALMRLAVTRKDVHYKASGRIHIFWREL